MNYLTRWQRPELTTWPGFGRLTNLRDEIDRLFELPLAELARSSQLLSGWTPALDVFEDTDNVVVRAELAERHFGAGFRRVVEANRYRDHSEGDDAFPHRSGHGAEFIGKRPAAGYFS